MTVNLDDLLSELTEQRRVSADRIIGEMQEKLAELKEKDLQSRDLRSLYDSMNRLSGIVGGLSAINGVRRESFRVTGLG